MVHDRRSAKQAASVHLSAGRQQSTLDVVKPMAKPDGPLQRLSERVYMQGAGQNVPPDKVEFVSWVISCSASFIHCWLFSQDNLRSGDATLATTLEKTVGISLNAAFHNNGQWKLTSQGTLLVCPVTAGATMVSRISCATIKPGSDKLRLEGTRIVLLKEK